MPRKQRTKSAKKAHRTYRRRRRRRWQRKRRERRMSATDILLFQILRQLQIGQVFTKPPTDPYARGAIVPPMKTAQKVSEEEYRRAANQPIVNVQPLYPLPF